MGQYNRNNKAFQSNANRPHANSTSNTVNKFARAGSDPVQKGAGPCTEERELRSQARSKLNKFERIHEAGSLCRGCRALQKEVGKALYRGGKAGSCTGTPVEGQTHRHTRLPFSILLLFVRTLIPTRLLCH